jgi:NAD(P)-dependent dehydrogenase (short-subunit alcohol dehydrogenase family)
MPSILITGASSGIGEALAHALATPATTLHLSGRDRTRLDMVAAACRESGATVEPVLLDVRDAAAMAAWVGGAGKLDLVVANAGISAGTGEPGVEQPGQTRAIFATNVDGVFNTVLPAIEIMSAQPTGADGVRGRIAVIASIAALIATFAAPAYGASKAAVDAWAVASAPGLRRHGINLTSVCPGYIRTPMTARNRFRMPGLMDSERAARIILRGIAAGRVRVTFPWWMGLAARIGDLLPPERIGGLLARRRIGRVGPAMEREEP